MILKKLIFHSALLFTLLYSSTVMCQPLQRMGGTTQTKGTASHWFVSAQGDDANNGRTLKTSFRTLQKAAGVVNPGDVVLIGNGIYTDTNRNSGSAVLSITRSGRSDAWITWKAIPGQHPQINPLGWAGIQITGSYHVIDGLTVMGSNDSIVLLKAQEDAKKPAANPYFNTNGIAVDGRKNDPDQKPHHIIIRNCIVGKCAGGGIVGLEMDYLTIEDCKVFDNSWFMRYAGSGITTLNNWRFDDAPGYHIIIQRNYVWNNKTLVPWDRTGKLSDGNGILLDVTDTDQSGGATNPNADSVVRKEPVTQTIKTKPKRPEWKGRALIANNLSAYNGGSGIHVFRTKYVDIINNTTYHNGGIVGYQELFPNRSEDIVILNNIIVPRPGGSVTSDNRNKNIRWDYNLYSIPQSFFKGENNIVATPEFLNVQVDLTKANFRVASGSPALNSGTNDVPQPTDITKKPRTNKGRDRGAYEL